VARFKAEGVEGLKDRSSRPHRLRRPTPTAIVEQVEALRRQRWTGKQIAAEVGVSRPSIEMTTPASLSTAVNARLVNWLPWSVLKISGLPKRASASSIASTQNRGTFALLEEALAYWRGLGVSERHRFRFHHVSTDEVFGSLSETGVFNENSPYRPTSPYAASKAASDHLVRAWYHTYGLPIVVTNCSNNYGPHQFPEKFIPLMILNCLEGRALPVYGQGEHVREWLIVEDHVRAMTSVLRTGGSERPMPSAAVPRRPISRWYGRFVR